MISVADTTLPVISGCPSNSTVTAAVGDTTANWSEPSATDNSGIANIVF